MLTVPGEWLQSDRLQRYYLLGSNDDDVTDVTEDQAAHLMDRAVGLKRFESRPPGPAGSPR